MTAAKTRGRPNVGIDFSAYMLRHLVAAKATRGCVRASIWSRRKPTGWTESQRKPLFVNKHKHRVQVPVMFQVWGRHQKYS